jgi:hypothetical protein
VLGLLIFSIFSYRRISWIIRRLSRKPALRPKMLASLRNLSLIALWTSLFGMLLFFGFFLRAYYAFNYEQPVAEIVTRPLRGPQSGSNSLVRLSTFDPHTTRYLLVKGDQWMLEGDILKWDAWLNFLGLHTRYRLTRFRGRFIKAKDERSRPASIFSLVEEEDHPFWRHLYRYGPKMPFVSTAYGNAAFQASNQSRRYLVYVSTSGFLVREKQAATQ